MTIPEFVEKYRDLPPGAHVPSDSVALAGRVMLLRSASAKLQFYTLQGDGTRVQVMLNFEHYGAKADYLAHARSVHRGAILGVVGMPAKAKKGELSIVPAEIQLLAPCLHMLPKVRCFFDFACTLLLLHIAAAHSLPRSWS